MAPLHRPGPAFARPPFWSVSRLPLIRDAQGATTAGAMHQRPLPRPHRRDFAEGRPPGILGLEMANADRSVAAGYSKPSASSTPVRTNCDMKRDTTLRSEKASQRREALGGLSVSSAPPGTRTPNLLIKSPIPVLFRRSLLLRYVLLHMGLGRSFKLPSSALFSPVLARPATRRQHAQGHFRPLWSG